MVIMCLNIKKKRPKSQPFNIYNCTEEELRDQCKKRHFSRENTDLAVSFFVNREKHSDIADRLYIDEKSVTKRKQRMRAKLI